MFKVNNTDTRTTPIAGWFWSENFQSVLEGQEEYVINIFLLPFPVCKYFLKVNNEETIDLVL